VDAGYRQGDLPRPAKSFVAGAIFQANRPDRVKSPSRPQSALIWTPETAEIWRFYFISDDISGCRTKNGKSGRLPIVAC
jgi:hypothetical protein